MVAAADPPRTAVRAPPLHVNSEISSPTLERFAAEGITLSNYYAYKYCGP
eukprot:COSAG01_NODE_20437_length_953_cov_1.367681_2_plen_50_part_00